MLPQELWYQLLSHGVYVLAMGDPGQLPPVKEEANPILEKPHVFLDEVMRQAQESAIIRLSMHIREGKDFRLFPTVSGEVKIVPHKREFADEDLCLLQASQVICGTNQERNRLNFRIRELLGKGSEPEPGDKIISLKNHWDDISPNGNALTNGAIGTIIDYKHFLQEYPRLDRFKDFQPTDLIYTNLLVDEEDEFSQLPIDYKCLTTGEASLTSKQEYQLGGYNKSLSARAKKDPWFDAIRYSKDIPYQFNYGYAITCWKAQGSEYPYVLGYEASWLKRQKPDEYKKYLYTLVTRAEKAVILVGD